MEEIVNITITNKDEKATMKIEGVITTENAYLFQEKLDEIAKTDTKTIYLDFSACRMVCSTAIGKLMMFYKEYAHDEKHIEIIKCTPTIYQLFQTIKLNMIMKISL